MSHPIVAIIPPMFGYEVATTYGSRFERSDSPIEIQVIWQEKSQTQGKDKEGRVLTVQSRFLKFTEVQE